MAYKQVYVQSLGRTLSCVMAAPSSAEPETHAPGLDRYSRLGGNCLHLHGEGGETHSRQAAGEWLHERGRRSDFLICTQVCHDDWDAAAKRPIDRFTPEAVRQDIAANLDLLQTDRLDLIYLDDRAGAPFEPVLEAIGGEISAGRVRAMGVRNWTVGRIRSAASYADRFGAPRIAAVITTELSLLTASAPMWPEYTPFDAAIEQIVREMGLAVFAHISDVNLGQCLLGDAEGQEHWRPAWLSRWQSRPNVERVQYIRDIAAARDITPRAVSIAWVLNRPYPVIGIATLPDLIGERSMEAETASQLGLDEAKLSAISISSA